MDSAIPLHSSSIIAPRRTPHDDLEEDEGFLCHSDYDVTYRRAEVAQHIAGTIPSSTIGKSHPLWDCSAEVCRSSPLEDQDDDVCDVFERSPSTEDFWSPFAEDVTEIEGVEDGTPKVYTLPPTFRLERTNFTVTTGGDERPSVDVVLSAIRKSLDAAGVDVLCLRDEDCVLECSFQKRNRFISLWLRVYLPPDPESGQLMSEKDFDRSAYLVEAQLREGDRLHFSALFKDIMKTFKSTDNGMTIGGSYRYRQRVRPAAGEGLVLEEATFAPVRQIPGRMNQQLHASLGDLESTLKVDSRLQNGDGGGARIERAVESFSALSLDDEHVPGRAEEDLDEDALGDLILLSQMLENTYLDVQADAAMALAGLTANDQLLHALSEPSAARAASTLCSASARLLVEAVHLPSRRQAAVIVANLAGIPALCEALLRSDSGITGDAETRWCHRNALIERLVGLVVVGHGNASSASDPEVNKVEEIGTRRECMRALVGLAKCKCISDEPAMQSLMECKVAGRGENDVILQSRLQECRSVLKGSK